VESGGSAFLVVLVARETNSAPRLFLFLEVDEPSKTAILSELNAPRSLEENWRRFEAVYRQIIDSYCGKAFLCNDRLSEGSVCALKTIDPGAAAKVRSFDIGDAFDAKISSFWLEKLEAS